jgi:5-methyltetrahydropteroyltriglutamate--homocysteine methyltransferase
MVESYDAGSMPFLGDLNKYMKGASSWDAGAPDESTEYFEKTTVNVFLDKLSTGIDVPNFPQFRDMNETFLSTMDGLEKTKHGYVEIGRLALKEGRGCLPEVSALRKNCREIGERYGGSFRLKVCVTGPYTLASFFPYRTSETFASMGEVVAAIVERNVFREKAGGVAVVSVDEPVFGFVDDPLVDRGSVGRERLFGAWEKVFHCAKVKGVRTVLHLHSSSDGLFWGVKGLDVLESHVGDPLYQLRQTKELLEKEDKFLKASVCVVDFDQLIREALAGSSGRKFGEHTLDQDVAEAWKKLQKGEVAGEVFLESVGVMRKRAMEVRARFGAERVPFLGPECGLRGFPSYACGVECLRRVAEVAKSVDVK